MKRTAILTLIGIMVVTGGAVAGGYYHHGHTMFSTSLSDMDTNNDGAVSFDEFNEARNAQNEAIFNALDTNADGAIDGDEYTDFLRAHGVGETG